MKYLVFLGILIIFSLALVSAANISLSYPLTVNYSQNFTINVTLENFSIDLYDVKIDIKNSSGDSIAEAWNGTGWKSTYYYVYDIINNSISNSSLILINITERYNGTASINVTIRSSSGITQLFSGFYINISNFSASQNSTTCTVSYSCGSWGSCSNSNQTRSCINTTASCINTTITERRSCDDSSDSDSDEEIYLELEDYEAIEIGEEKIITINAYNLNSEDYDIKLYVHYEDSDSAISKLYNLTQWVSGRYYAEGVLEGSGDKTITMKIRMKDDAKIGEAEITAKIREFDSSTVIAEITETINISEEEASESVAETTSVINQNENIINPNSTLSLNNINNSKENKIIYESKNEIIKKYAIFGFAGFLLLIIIFLLIKT